MPHQSQWQGGCLSPVVFSQPPQHIHPVFVKKVEIVQTSDTFHGFIQIISQSLLLQIIQPCSRTVVYFKTFYRWLTDICLSNSQWDHLFCSKRFTIKMWKKSSRLFWKNTSNTVHNKWLKRPSFSCLNETFIWLKSYPEKIFNSLL